jgi:hypothetical protein
MVLLAPGRPIRALASDGCCAARFRWRPLSAVDRGATRGDVAKNFYDVAKESVQCCEPSSVQHPTRDVCIDVASLFVVCCEQHASNIQCFGKKVQGAHGCPPVSRIHTFPNQFHVFRFPICNIGIMKKELWNMNNEILQHRDFTCATSIMNVSPTGYCMQHEWNTNATFKITITTLDCFICTQWRNQEFSVGGAG